MVLFPFLGAFVLGIATLMKSEKSEFLAGPIASAAIFLSFFQAMRIALVHLRDLNVAATVADLGVWIQAGNIHLPLQFRADALSSVMALVVTGVSFLIHVYSIGYMSHDKSRTRYFTYLNLFCGFMLVLITGASLPILFVGWEGVGLCSYLLIGFWYSDVAKAWAGRKAFIVNRIGDAGFLLAMVLIFREFGTLDISTLASGSMILSADPQTLEWIAILLFIGCVGKSAQFPLYVWLPDAMAGPTPVSALIHAATMVTAGVYLLGRMSFLYMLTPMASHLVAVTGACTALFAAVVALNQNDIKKVLAFSTVSQLGFMVLAMGVGAFDAGIFHLTTHAYFKALLFLAAGSVMHSLGNVQDIRKMGGLKNYIVGTTITFFLGYLAIIGFPPFAGWFSKDAILHAVYVSGEGVLFWMALIAALLTTVYMTRLFCLVFLGIPRIPKHALHSVHESPRSMLIPMIILGFLSFIGGFGPLSFGKNLKSMFGVGDHVVHSHAGGLSEGGLAAWITIAVFVTAVLTVRAYTTWLPKLQKVTPRGRRIQRMLERQLYVDEGLVWFARRGSAFFAKGSGLIDRLGIDAAVNWVGQTVSGAAGVIARFQSGLTQVYALMILIGSILMVWFLLGGGA